MSKISEPAVPIESTVEEEASLQTRRMAQESEMDITPMIDITFLLLIFFLVATRMDPSGGVQLPKARHGTAVQTRQAVVITLSRDENDRTQIYKGDGKNPENLVADGDLAQQEQEIVQYIDEGLNAVSPKEYVLIKAERDLKHRDVAQVARAVTQIPDVGLFWAVLEEQ